MPTYAVTMVHGPHWDPDRATREQDGWDDHAEFMDGLVDDGFVILGGPLSTGAQLAVEAAGEEEIRARLSGDPWAPARLLCVGAVEPWPLWLDSRGSTDH